MQINNKLVGNRIKKIRSEKGMSQEEFGLLIKNAHKSLVSKWEKGQSLPNNDRLKRIAEIGETTVDFILYGSLDDYARNLLKELEKELHEDDSINKGTISLIVNDVENRLFPKYLRHSFKDQESLDKAFNEYKKDAIELWLNQENLDIEILARLDRQSSDDINDNLKYFYSDFYKNEDNSIDSEEKISERSNEFIKRLQKFDNYKRAYIDSLRFLDNKEMVKELDKIDIYTDNLNKLQ